MKPRVFISYQHAELQRAQEICKYLRCAGVDPWLDREQLRGGDDWESEIKNAVRQSCAFVVLLSKRFDEIGFRQKEVRWAIDALNERPPGSGFIIPFALEPCEIPNWCRPLHVAASATEVSGFSYLLNAIEKHCKTELPPLHFKSCYFGYSGADEKFVERLYSDLEGAGVACWAWSRSLQLGDDIWRELTAAIDRSDVFLLVASQHSLWQPELIREFRRALDREDRMYRESRKEPNFIVPINLDDHVFQWQHSLRADLTRRVMIHARGWEDQTVYIRIREKLLFEVLLEVDSG